MRNRTRELPILLLLGGLTPVLADNRLLVELHDSSALPRVLNQYSLTLKSTAGGTNIVTAPDAIAGTELVYGLSRDPAVRSVELDRASAVSEAETRAPMSPDPAVLARFAADPSYTLYHGGIVRGGYLNQPASLLIERAEAHQYYATGSGVVAVIDTGIDPYHPGLFGSLVPGYDFLSNQPGFPSDWQDLSARQAGALAQSTVALLDGGGRPAILNQSTVALLDQSTVALLDGTLPAAFGHGTMVAGLIHLAAPTAKIMPLRAFRADGTGNLSDIVRAIYYAVDHGARVINMSFSLDSPSPELKAAMDYAAARKVICVASSGNNAKSGAVYPAAYGYVIAVGSTTNNDRRSSFSNYGSMCARTAAPGEGLITFYPGNNYAAVWGTSFSSALVAGGVALALQVRSYVEPGKLMDAIESGPRIEDQKLGDARLDLYKLTRYLKYNH